MLLSILDPGVCLDEELVEEYSLETEADLPRSFHDLAKSLARKMSYASSSLGWRQGERAASVSPPPLRTLSMISRQFSATTISNVSTQFALRLAFLALSSSASSKTTHVLLVSSRARRASIRLVTRLAIR